MKSNARVKTNSQIPAPILPTGDSTPQPSAGAATLAARLGLVLLVTGLLTRVLFLGSPNQVVFDEVHFGKFVTAYCCTHSRFFDIHPPHAKLLIAGAITLGGYQGKQEFKNIGEKYGDSSPWSFRIVPALVGTALPILVFVLLLQLGGTVPAAFLGGLALALDNGLIIQSRVIALDGVLLIAQVGALVALFAARTRFGAKRYAFYALSGACCGLAVGTKFTGLAAPALVSIVIVVDFWRERGKRAGLNALKYFALVGACAVAVYLIGWAFHFALLSKPGSGDAFYQVTGNFFHDLQVAHESMLSKNYGLTAGHPNASHWWSWPLMLTPIFYWINNGASLYFIGNPAVWWGGSLLFIQIFLLAGLRKVTDLKTDFRIRSLWFPLAAYSIALLPLTPVPRALFLYHYLTPLVFSVVTTALWFDRVGFTRNTALTQQRRAYFTAIGVLVGGFILMSPVTFAIPMPAWYWGMMPWALYH